jgi:hypothetical protein
METGGTSLSITRCLFAAVLLLLVAGCSGNSTFVYRPASPVRGGQALPLKLAVLPFADGTGNYTVRGSVLTPGNCTHNLAKGGIGGRITALTPDLWAKAFADDLAASGDWRSVRFAYGMPDLADEDFIVEGTLLSADSGLLHLKGPNRFALSLTARRKEGGGPVWAKEVAREWEIPDGFFAGCGFPEQCRTDRAHADVTRVMRLLFAEAGTDLARTIGGLPGNRAGEDARAPAASPGPKPAPETVDETIEGILKENR